MKTKSLYLKKNQQPFSVVLLMLYVLLIIGLLGSCAATYDTFAYDDIYSVKESAYPPYESVADETSYSTFKNRKWNSVDENIVAQSSTEYPQDKSQEEVQYREERRCEDILRWYDGCGCTYSQWQRTSRYSSYNRVSWTIAVGTPFWGVGYPHAHYAPYWSWQPSLYWGYGYNGLYSGYTLPMYAHFGHVIIVNHYYPIYYRPYGYGYGYYGYGYNGYYGHGYNGLYSGYAKNSVNHQIEQKVYKGHRGINSTGNANPNGRKYSPNALKSTVNSVNNTNAIYRNLDQQLNNSVTLGEANKQVSVRELSAKETVANMRTLERTTTVKSVDAIRYDSNSDRPVISREYVNTSTIEKSVNRNNSAVDRPATLPQRTITPSGSSETNYRKNYPQRSDRPTTVSPSKGTIQGSSSRDSYNRSSTPIKQSSSTPMRTSSPAPRQQSTATPSRSTNTPQRSANPSSSSSYRSSSSPSGTSTRSNSGRSR